MKARTNELLNLLLWGADRLARPTFCNLTDSYEAWAYRRGFYRQLERLEERQLIERRADAAVAAVYRLTETGRLAALGGRDPAARWGRGWDGHWRLVVFDLPEAKNHARVKLRRFLQANGFGYLQNSVWVSPDPLTPIAQELSAHAGDVESILTLEARPAAGEADSSIVAGAWDFPKINRRYEKCLEALRALPDADIRDKEQAEELHEWSRREQAAWQEAVVTDPLLPASLLPPDYLGKKVWQERSRVLAAAAKLIRVRQ